MREETPVNTKPIFQSVFGDQWEMLPPVMKNHYAVRPNTDDWVKVEGRLDITISPFVSLMARLTGMLLAHSGKDVPVTVVFKSDKAGAFHFERTFHFATHGDVRFHSRMERMEGNELVEFIRFGVGWKLACFWDGSKIVLQHKGYVWRILGLMIPVPLAWIIGKGHAEEVPLSKDRFSMWTHAKHPLFGKTFGYAGEFKVTEVSCGQS